MFLTITFEFKVGLPHSKKTKTKKAFALISPLKMIKNAFYIILKAYFVLKLFEFLFWIFGQVEKTACLEGQS